MDPKDASAPFPVAALQAPANETPASRNSIALPASLAQLTALFALQRELMRVSAAWLPGVPYWDAKQAIARHVLNDAHHAEALLKRLHELKAAGAEHQQQGGIVALVGNLASAAHGDEWLRGLYGVVKPWLIRCLEGYLQASDPVMDEPTHAILQRSIAELKAQVAWFHNYRPGFSAFETADSKSWLDYVQARLAGLELSAGLVPRMEVPPLPPGHHPFTGIAAVRRDQTMRVQEKSGFPREGTTFAEKRFLIFYNHTQEMQFAESLCAIIYETAEMPWAFHYDLARHMADEVRHATMGQTRLQQLGVALTEVPMQTQHYEFRSHLDPLERFCLMTLVMEATAFERKRANVELFEANADRISALYESYDIKDEMLHTNLGHVWVPVMLRVYHDSRSVRELTEHCRSQIAQVITEYPANAANMLNR
jgi:hypothetical protein